VVVPSLEFPIKVGFGDGIMQSKAMLLLAATITLGGCQTYGNDEMASYLQRKDTVTLSAGDASRANALAQTIHPWPHGVGDNRIPMEGTRAVGAIATYNCPNPKQGPLTTTTQSQTQSQSGSGGSGTATTNSTAQTGRPTVC
jgi:hypothetical protein